MGRLDHDQGRAVRLRAHALIGRAPRCDVHVPDRTVSTEHAALRWQDGRWHLRDLGSRNGTFVDGERLDPGGSRALAAGARLGFGAVEGWVLADAAAPGPLARAADGREVRATDGLLALPSADDPDVVVYADAQGRFWAERDGERAPAGRQVEAGGVSWELDLPAEVDGTATVAGARRLDALRLHFTVSRNEEHVTLALEHRGRAEALNARDHLYVLVTLARLRLQDAHLPLAEQGWVDRATLERMLGVDTGALNVAIYRARRQLAAAGVDGAADVVEVRRGHRRFGVEPDRVTVSTA